jgi:chromosome segregation ATPase
MIEWIMNFAIGFLAAALLGLLFLPAVHNRAVRLTMKRLEASTPTSLAEIRADKDQLRAEFAVSARRLEMKVEKLKVQTTAQIAELGRKTDAINQLKKDLTEKSVMNVALEARTKPLRDQLSAAEEELQRKSNALVEAGRQLAENQAELAKVWRELGERALVA